MALTRLDLDVAGCGNPDCEGCSDDLLVLRGRCHMDSPTWTWYDKRTGTLTVTCATCKKLITEIEVAKGG